MSDEISDDLKRLTSAISNEVYARILALARAGGAE